MHLFVSFILKAIAVFAKDVVLYDVGEVDNCSSGSVSHRLSFAVAVFREERFFLSSRTVKEKKNSVRSSLGEHDTCGPIIHIRRTSTRSHVERGFKRLSNYHFYSFKNNMST